MASDEWITTTEACNISGYHPYYLREMIRKGRINARKFGTIWQIDRRSLLEYLMDAKNSEDMRRGPKHDIP